MSYRKAEEILPKEIIKIIQTFIAAHNAVLFFDSFESSWVNPKKMGTLPNGFITEKSAANVSKNKSIFVFWVSLKVTKISLIYNRN